MMDGLDPLICPEDSFELVFSSEWLCAMVSETVFVTFSTMKLGCYVTKYNTCGITFMEISVSTRILFRYFELKIYFFLFSTIF